MLTAQMAASRSKGSIHPPVCITAFDLLWIKLLVQPVTVRLQGGDGWMRFCASNFLLNDKFFVTSQKKMV